MNSNKKTLTAILILLVMCTGISISYAFFKVASSNNNANTNVTINGAALCMSLQLSSNNITISNEYAVPISDSKALSSDTYKTSVTITNNCSTSQSFNLLLVPSSSNTMPIKALKYALVEEGTSVPTTGTLISNEYSLDSTIKKQLLTIKNETLNNGFSVGSGTVSSGTKTYSLYLWIDKDEGVFGNGSTMNKSLNAYLTLGSGSTIGTQLVKGGLYQTIENRYNEDKKYLGLYTGEGADTYTYPVYYYKGNVQNNNVLFGGFCWKIVRTTETGGVKIVYNGKQKDEVQISPIEQSSYANVSNDATYLYTFDSTTKTWSSTNHDHSTTGTITFSVDTVGDYYLNYEVSSETCCDKAEFLKGTTSLGKFADSGTIALKGLTTSDVITVKYSKDGSVSKNDDMVTFSIGKAVGEPVKSCNNTGTDSQIGKSAFNNDYKSPAYVGYMYNKDKVYTVSSRVIINSTYFSGVKAYADSVTYDSSTKKYTLDSATATTLSVSTSNGSTLVGKYTCNQSTTTATCTNVYYIAGYSKDYIYYYLLSNGDVDGTDKGSNYVFGKSFTYANGSYSLSDTTTIHSDDWATKKTTVNNYHYTCLSSGTTCSSIYYVYYISNGTTYYTTLTGGKSVSDALNEMLYADDVNKDDSTIKTYIDEWYENKLKDKYDDKLEDTIFCNDRSTTSLGGWNPNGGSSILQFKNYSYSTNQSLVCANETDRFSMSNSKAKLKYPIGLLSSPELILASYGSSHYFNNGQDVWLGSPNDFDGGGVAYAGGVRASGFSGDGVLHSNGVRPSVSIKPGTSFSSGDGSYTSPFVID